MFLEESVSLGNYIDTYEKKHNAHGQESNFVRITLKGLSALAAEHGVDSIQYKTGQQILKEFLQTVSFASPIGCVTHQAASFRQLSV